MSAQVKHTLAALLAAAAIVAPVSAQAKGGKGHGGEGFGHEQNHGGGGGGKHAEQRQVRSFQDQRFAPRQSFEVRGNGNPNRARRERLAPAETFAIDRMQKPEAASKRWKNERHAERAARSSPETRSARGQRNLVPYAVAPGSERGFGFDRKMNKLVAKQQRATYRAEAKKERQWAKQPRRSLNQAARVAPAVVFDRSFADYPRTVRYAAAPIYRMPEVREFGSYPAYTSGYDYAPYYRQYDANSFVGWSYPEPYPEYSPYSTSSPYARYDAGYSNDGLGGLLGGSSGGLGDMLVTLLPLILGDSLGLDGLTGSLGTGLLGSSMPGLPSGYGLSDYPAVDYADSAYPYQEPSFSGGLLGADQNLTGGNDLMSVVQLALGSGLLGSNSGGLDGLGGLLGLGGSLGLGAGLSGPDPVYAYTDPYSSNTGLLSAFGI